jgi:hypothetical protein
MKRKRKQPPRRPVQLPADLHSDLAEIGKRYTRTVGQQAIAMLRKAVFEEVTK